MMYKRVLLYDVMWNARQVTIIKIFCLSVSTLYTLPPPPPYFGALCHVIHVSTLHVLSPPHHHHHHHQVKFGPFCCMGRYFSLFCATAQQSYCHGMGICPVSVKLVFSEIVSKLMPITIRKEKIKWTLAPLNYTTDLHAKIHIFSWGSIPKVLQELQNLKYWIFVFFFGC